MRSFTTSHASRVLLALMLLLGVTHADAADAPAEANVPGAYLDTQTRARELIGQPDRLIALWRDFAQAHDGHDLADVARLNQALWMLHKTFQQANGRPGIGADVRALLTLAPPTEEGRRASALYKHVHHATLALRAQIAMIDLAARLQDYYRQHIEYPPSLEALVDAEMITSGQLVDPFGEPFGYRARARSIMPDIPRQAYTLRCITIEADHEELPAMLEQLDASVEGIEISTLVPEEGRAYVRERRDDGSWTSARRWDIGQSRADVQLWAVYDNYLLVAWREVPRTIRAQ